MSNRQIPRFPKSLWNVDSFEELTESQRNNMASRLRHIEDTLAAIESIREIPVGTSESEHAYSVVDSVELDLMILLSVPSDREQVSPWQVHSSWTFNTSAAQMLTVLPPQLTTYLQEPLPSISSTVSDFVAWAIKSAGVLRFVLEAFYTATDIHAALAALVAIDVCIGQLLVGFSMQRFNPHLPR